MQKLTQRSGGTAEGNAKQVDPGILRDRIATVLLDAFSFVSSSRVSDTVRTWLDRLDLSALPPAQEATLMTEAFLMATTLAVFTSSAGGTVAVDRLARARMPLDSADAAAIAALRQTEFRLVQVQDAGGNGTARLRDQASDEVIVLHGSSLSAAHAGLHLAVWLAPLPLGGLVCTSGITPLDKAALAVGMSFVRAGRPGLVNPVRCADAVYRHVLRHGTLRIPGLNEPLPGEEDDCGDDEDDLDDIAQDWARPGAERAADASRRCGPRPSSKDARSRRRWPRPRRLPSCWTATG